MPLLNAILFQRKMKIPPPVLLPRLAVHLQNFKKMYFIICSDKRMSESNEVIVMKVARAVGFMNPVYVSYSL